MKKSVLLMFFMFAAVIYPQEINQKPDNGKTVRDTSGRNAMVLTLNSAISMALERNKDILISNEDVKKSEAQISEAYGNAYPQVTAEAGYTRNLELPKMIFAGQTFTIGSDNSYSANLTLSQVLFSAKVNTAIKIAKEYKNYTGYNAQTVREDVVLEVKKAFYSVLLTQRLVEVSREGLRLAKANYDNLSQLYKQGSASEFDLLRAEVQVANTEPTVSKAENSYELAKNALRNLLSISLDRDIDLVGSLEMEELSANVIEDESREALRRNSALLGLESYERILDKNVLIEKADYYPTLAAFGTVQYQAQDNTFDVGDYNWIRSTMVGLNVSIPIFSGMQTKYRVQQAQIDKQKVVLNRQKLEEGIKIQLEESRLRMSEARSRVMAQSRSVEQAERAQGIAEVRYKSGLGTQLELIDAQVALTSTRINKAQAIYDYLIARSDWERQSGYTK
ncbi:MAG: TolC family protein [Bacteroidota bacterium]